MKVYIAGKITDNPGYKEQFAEAEAKLASQGHTTMNPTILPQGFEHSEYMTVCLSMIDVCDGVFFLTNWRDSKGAKAEHRYAKQSRKDILYQEDDVIRDALCKAENEVERLMGKLEEAVKQIKPHYAICANRHGCSDLSCCHDCDNWEWRD